MVGILGTPGTWHSQELQVALETKGAKVIYVDPTRLTAKLGSGDGVSGSGIDLTDLNFLFVREIPGGSLEQIIFRMDALHQLENDGLRIINSPYAIEKMVDKYYTLSLLKQAGIRVPETIVTEDITQAMDAFQVLGGDVVVKPLFGSRGIGMVRLTDTDTAWRAFRALQLGGYVYYVQQFLPHDNRDLRVVVVGNDCMAAMERVAHSWKTNIAAGARPIHAELGPQACEICLQASHIVGADYSGVDLLRTTTGELFVLEINSMPAWQGLQQVTPFNIADRIIEFVMDLM